MSAEARTTIRNVGLLIVQRGFHVAAGLLFATLVPRAMGPATYGRYALITSVSLWFTLISGLGAVAMMSRFVPQFVMRNDPAGLRKFISHLLVLRAMNGLVAAVAYLVLAVFWLRELDWVALAFVAGALSVRAAGNLFFALFLGLNQAARWGMGELLRRWLSLVLVLAGFLAGGLRGACLGWMLTSFGVFAVGLWWGRAYLRWSEMRVNRRYLTPFLRVGVSFAAGNAFLAFTQRSGETLVQLASADFVQVGYYGVAYGIYLTASQGFWQLSVPFAPLLTTLREQGRMDALKEWIERLLKGMAVAGVAATFGVLLLGDNLVPLVLGRAYRPVAASLLPLMVALLTLALGTVGRLLTVSCERPGVAVTAAAIELTAFWCVGLPLVAWRGSLGACIAVPIASALYASHITQRMSREVGYSLRAWWMTIGSGALFLPMVWARSSFAVNAGLYLLFLVGYGALLLSLRIVTVAEFTALHGALRPGRVRVTPSIAAQAGDEII